MTARESGVLTAILVAAVALGPVSTDLYLPSLPAIGRALSADVLQTQLTLSVFLVGFAVGQLAFGSLSDRFGRRPVLIGGFALFGLASLACMLAWSIEALVAARAVQALGACAGVVMSRAVIRDVFGPDGAARKMAQIGSIMAFAPAAGPILGGFIEAAAGWRWNFAVLVVFAIGAFALTIAKVPETNQHQDPHALDPWRMAMNYRELLGHRRFLGYVLTVACVYSGLFAFISGSSFVIIEVLGLPPEVYGFCFAAVVIGYFTGTRLTAALTQRLGVPRMVRLGCWFLLTGGGAMLAIVLAGLPRPGPLGAALIVGPHMIYMVGLGLVMPNALAGAIGPFPRMAGAASALLGFIQMSLAATVGIAVGHLFDGTALPMAAAIATMAVATRASFALTRD